MLELNNFIFLDIAPVTKITGFSVIVIKLLLFIDF